jgi:hypothetical protein
MSTEQLTEELKGLTEGYILFSPLTNMPYVECENENYNDQVRMYAKKDAAEAAVKELEEAGIRTTVRELKTVEVKVQNTESNGKKMYLNQVRQQLTILPSIGLNAVGFTGSDGEMLTLELTDVLPAEFVEKLDGNTSYQPNLQLTGMYLMQEARRKKEFVDPKQLKEMDEEFSSNLVKSRMFLAVLPPEGKEQERQVNLKDCKMPYLKHQNGDIFFPLFTDIWEFQKYAQGKKELRPVQIPFADVTKFWVKDAKAYMINPMGFSLPITKEMIPRILQRFGVGLSSPANENQ